MILTVTYITYYLKWCWCYKPGQRSSN